MDIAAFQKPFIDCKAIYEEEEGKSGDNSMSPPDMTTSKGNTNHVTNAVKVATTAVSNEPVTVSAEQNPTERCGFATIKDDAETNYHSNDKLGVSVSGKDAADCNGTKTNDGIVNGSVHETKPSSSLPSPVHSTDSVTVTSVDLESLDNHTGVLHVYFLVIEGLASTVASCPKYYQPQTLEVLFELMRSVAIVPGTGP